MSQNFKIEQGLRAAKSIEDEMLGNRREKAFDIADNVAFTYAMEVYAEGKYESVGNHHGSWNLRVYHQFMEKADSAITHRVANLNLILVSYFSPLREKDNPFENVKRENWEYIVYGKLDFNNTLFWQKVRGHFTRILDSYIYAYPNNTPEKNANRISQIDWAYFSEVIAIVATIVANHGDNQKTIIGKAAKMPLNQREAILRALYRFLKIETDTKRNEIVAISRFKALRVLNADRQLIIELQIAEIQKELSLLKPLSEEEKQRKAEYQKIYPKLYLPEIVSDNEKRELLIQAIELLQAVEFDITKMITLAEKLKQLQPQTKRRKYKRLRIVKDYTLYLAEQFLRNNALKGVDMFETLRLLIVCSPFLKQHKLRFHSLETIGELFAQRYFGVSMGFLRNAFPPPSFPTETYVFYATGLWRDYDTYGYRYRFSVYYLCYVWCKAIHVFANSDLNESEEKNKEVFGDLLHKRTQLRDSFFLATRQTFRKLNSQIAEADALFYGCTQKSETHFFGKEWQNAYGHTPITHWWYYRKLGFNSAIIGNS
jgi:hypothetical protein